MRARIEQIVVALALVVWTAGAGWADRILVKNSDLSVSISEDVELLRHHHAAYEESFSLRQGGQTIQLRHREGDLWLNLPNAVLRIRRQPSEGGESYTLVADLGGQRVEIRRGPREIAWRLPQDDVFFQTRGGYVVQAIGGQDHLKIRRNTPAREVAVESRAGLSEFKLVDGRLELLDGPPLVSHSYFVRGLRYQLGGVRIDLPLPQDIFTASLEEDRVLTLAETLIGPAPGADPGAFPAQTKRERVGDPLRAEPADTSGSPLRAIEGDRSEDPMHLRRERRPDSRTDPLRATVGEDSEEVLRVKNY